MQTRTGDRSRLERKILNNFRTIETRMITSIFALAEVPRLCAMAQRGTQLLRENAMTRRLFAEFFGTFWLVFGGCGSAVFAAAFPELGIGFAGVALAFGLTVLTMAYAVGGISGGHFNPAVSVGLLAAGRFDAKDLLPYIIAQLVGAVAAAVMLYLIVSGKSDFAGVGGFASNGYDAASPGGYSMMSALLIEVLLTFFFLLIILGSTSGRAPAGFAPIAIGLALTLIHLISIPITNTSVNPARSTGVALFAEGPALAQLWLFWVAPIIGAALAGVVYKATLTDD
jgi:aquaporin Z